MIGWFGEAVRRKDASEAARSVDISEGVIRKLWWKIVPLLFLCYFAAYLDRVNVAFAALHMNGDLGFTATQYGIGASIFFLAYFLFEVPSNVCLEKFGPRRWIGRIMLTWGIVSGLMATVSSPTSFYALRFLLGAAEAGFVPGVVLYLSWWFPERYRIRAVSAFFLAMPLSSVIGGPISTVLLKLDGLGGLAGWQWLFIIESLPAIALSIVVWNGLPTEYRSVGFLSAEEKAWLDQQFEPETRIHRNPSLWSALRQPVVWLMAAAAFGVNFAQYAFGLWLPLVVKDMVHSDLLVGLITAIPYTLGAIFMLLAARRAEARRRLPYLLVGCLITASSLFLLYWTRDTFLMLVMLCLCAIGMFIFIGTFWGTAPGWIVPRQRIVGVAFVNSIGGLSGYFGPYALGVLKDMTGSFNVSLALMGVGPAVAMVALICLSGRVMRPAWPGAAVESRG